MSITQESKLKQGLGFWTLIAIGAGLNIGAAWFITPAVMAGITGSSLPLARILAVIPIFLILPAFMMLTSAYPTSGGLYRYGKLVSPHFAVANILLLIVGWITNIAMMATGLEIYVQAYFPQVSPQLVGFLALTLFYILNIIGVRIAGVVQGVLFSCLMFIMVCIMLPGLIYIQPQNVIPPVFNAGIGGMILVAALTFQLAGGGLLFVDAGDEVIGKGKTFMKAIPFSIALAALLALIVETVAVGTIGWSNLATAGTLTPAIQTYLPDNFAVIMITVGAIIASLTSIHGIMLLTAREVLATAADGVLPKFMYSVNSKFGTPHWALTVLYILIAAVFIIDPGIVVLSAVTNVALTIAYIFVAIAALMLATKYPEIYEKSLFKPKNKALFFTYSIIGCVFMIAFNIILLYNFGFNVAMTIIVLYIALIIYAYFIRVHEKPRITKSDIDIQA